MKKVYKAHILYTKERNRFEVLENGYIAVDADGCVTGVGTDLASVADASERRNDLNTDAWKRQLLYFRGFFIGNLGSFVLSLQFLDALAPRRAFNARSLFNSTSIPFHSIIRGFFIGNFLKLKGS